MKIKVNCLSDLNQLLDELNWPSDLILPVHAYNLVYERIEPSRRRQSEDREYVLWKEVRIHPAKEPQREQRCVDLSEAELEEF